MSERIGKVERVDKQDLVANDWENTLSNVPYNGGETQESNRAELEQQTVDKLNQNRSAKKAFQKIILGVAMTATVIGSAVGIFNSLEQRGESRPVTIGDAIEAADVFVDKDSEDLVWFEEITDNTGLNVEYNQYFRDKGQSYDGTLQGDVAQVEMNWWEGAGSMYRATDQDADGRWDVVQKFDVDTEELSTINLGDLEDVDAETLTMSSAEQLFD